MIEHEVVQGTEDWYILRSGIPSASMFNKIINEKALLKDELIEKLLHVDTAANLKKLRVADLREIAEERGIDISPNLELAQTDYAEQLAAESIGGYDVDEWLSEYNNEHMAHGKASELHAIKFYQDVTGLETKDVGFITDDQKSYGCSPDQLVGDDGLLEIKSPLGKNLIKYWMEYKETGKCPKDFRMQVQGQLMVTGRAWCDLVLYHPRITPKILRVTPDNPLQENLKQQIHELIQKRDMIIAEMADF